MPYEQCQAQSVVVHAHVLHCMIVNEPEPWGFRGDPESIAAELSQMSFRQSLGGGDANISRKECASLVSASSSSSACCDSWQSLLPATSESLKTDGLCILQEGTASNTPATSVSELTPCTVRVSSAFVAVFWLSAVLTVVDDGTVDCTMGFRTHPDNHHSQTDAQLFSCKFIIC